MVSTKLGVHGAHRLNALFKYKLLCDYPQPLSAFTVSIIGIMIAERIFYDKSLSNRYVLEEGESYI